MPNTIKNSTLLAGNKKSIIYYTLVCVGNAQEIASIVYDSSVLASLIGVTDPLTSTIVNIKYSCNSAAGVVRLDWDATTDVAAWAMPFQGNEGEYDFECIGGLKNQGVLVELVIS